MNLIVRGLVCTVGDIGIGGHLGPSSLVDKQIRSERLECSQVAMEPILLVGELEIPW